MIKKILFYLLMLSLFSGYSSYSSAAPEESEVYNVAAAQKELAKIKKIDLETASLSQVEILTKQVDAYVDHGKQCAVISQQELEQIDKTLETLGEKVKGEPRDIARERGILLRKKSEVEVRLAQCQLLTLKASELLKTLQDNKKHIFKKALFLKSAGIVKVVNSTELMNLKWLDSFRSYIVNGTGILSVSWWSFLPIVVIVWIGFWSGRKIDSLFERSSSLIENKGFFYDFLREAGSRGGNFLFPFTLAATSISLSILLSGSDPPSYLPSLLTGILLFVVIVKTGKIYSSVLVESGDEEKNGEKQEVRISIHAFFRLYLFASLSGFLWFLLASPLNAALPEYVFYLARAVILSLWYISLLLISWFFCSFARLKIARRIVRIFVAFMSGLILWCELSGYRILSVYILAGMSGTMLMILFLGVFNNVTDEVLGGFGKGNYGWQQRIRGRLGIKNEEVLRGVIWTNGLVKLLLFLGFIYLILRLWGLSTVYAVLFYNWIVDGFTVGSITIVPSRIAIGLLMFSLGWTVVSFVNDKIVSRWLKQSELAPSIQDAFSTVLGYLGYALVILFALSAGGIDFSGLAMVAGALSVGIGFGLQNIVNNFVSGLILLFERPIKRGDWIIVGDTEGYVKKISVRSTIIQTFDRSDVIVPNSELISSQVTNMMLWDLRGRVKLRVGVAYGSDVELVRDVLIDVAKRHPEVITNNTAPYPAVYFQTFGDSSLDFDLFCHIRNVDKRLGVYSDLHFEIYRAFKENGIEIPFPQRDVYLKGHFAGSDSLEKAEMATNGSAESI